MKEEHKHPAGLVHPFPIPKWKQDSVIIDFITKFPRTLKQHDSIMVLVNKLKNSCHFIHVHSTFNEAKIA